MFFPAHREAVTALRYGKRLPTAIYLFHPPFVSLVPSCETLPTIPAPLLTTILRAETAARPDLAWNLLKLHLDQFALTFLTYPEFDTDPHPALAEATRINLHTGTVVRTDYRPRVNPPILHRKETFLPPDDPRIPAFAALTKSEEAAGLYRDPSRIGLRLPWLTLLKRLGLTHDGHTLIPLPPTIAASPSAPAANPHCSRPLRGRGAGGGQAAGPLQSGRAVSAPIQTPRAQRPSSDDHLPPPPHTETALPDTLPDNPISPNSPPTSPPPEIARHRTAIKRYDLSKPVKQLLERGLLRKTDTFFDYGCGHGMDLQALQTLGYQAAGWDPAFRPTAPKTSAAVVNLGYVLNVIEDPAERLTALRTAFALAERTLIVSTLAAGQETDAHSRPYGDGFLTKANTFQKFYAPGELERLIEETLDAEASTLGLGMCVVFKHADDAELFEASRSRRRIDWSDISTQLRFTAPAARERRHVDRYELHQELFGQFWQTLLDLGRTPEAGEFDRLTEVKKAAGGLNRAVALVVGHHGEEPWQIARKARTEDVQVYLAMAKFRRHFLRREIPLRIKNDIRSFFGDLPAAQAQARDLLFAAGDPGEIELACETVTFGWQDADSLMLHRSLFAELPPLLRIYVQCAAFRYGDPAQADIIKIHKRSGKITFQHYDDFDGKPLPELQTRIKVNLRNLFVEVFDHFAGPKIQLLYFKERFVAKTHPGRTAMESFSAKLRKLGLSEAMIGFGPEKQSFLSTLASAGLNESLDLIKDFGQCERIPLI